MEVKVRIIRSPALSEVFEVSWLLCRAVSESRESITADDTCCVAGKTIMVARKIQCDDVEVNSLNK